jgi:1-deoxy-D-xylulose-5-phosphate reductoisomerase
MSDIIEQTMAKCTFSALHDYDTYVATDAEARRIAASLL